MAEAVNPAAIIGDSDPDRDWRIEPSTHADLYAEAAPALSAVLRDPAVARAARDYEEADRVANSTQKGFREVAEPANEWVLFAALAAATLLFLQALIPGAWPVRFAGAAAAVTGVFALVYITRLRERDDLERWRRHRAEAEQARVAYFRTVLQLAEGDPERVALAFEYVRRYLYESQLAYFAKRGGEHDERALGARDRIATLRAAGAGLVGLGGAAAVLAPAAGALTAVAGGLAAIASYLATEERWSRDAANATAYSRARRELAALSALPTAVRRAAPEDREAAARSFLDQVETVLANEHAEWKEGFDRRRLALEELERSLGQRRIAGD